MYLVFDPVYKAIAMVGYLCILVRWVIYHIDTLLFIPTLVASFLGSIDQLFRLWCFIPSVFSSSVV